MVTVSISTVNIPNLDFKVWARKSELLQVNFLRYLTKTEITSQRPFKLKYIYYDQFKDEIERMERVNYNTSIGRNVINFDDKEDVENL